VPQTIERDLANDGNCKSMDQFADVLADERDAGNNAPILVHDHFRGALIAIGDYLRPGDMAHVILYGANTGGISRVWLAGNALHVPPDLRDNCIEKPMTYAAPK